ncbi:MAG TPA: class I SAM-dependent methyltransferase [Myxococcota bacterium]|jgi:SAM-dependent methyltransferase
MAEPNAEQRTYWNEQAGPIWVAMQERMDAQIGAHGARALAALNARPGERILDVGCGCGDTALALARAVGASGRVLGVDLSAPMLARARERAAAAGLTNVAFEVADAQTHALPASALDALFSRFGVMFFEAPALAFANLARALRPGGRVAFACWQPVAANPWVAVPMAALASVLPLPPPPVPGAPGPFAFGDAERVRGILGEAGLGDVAFQSEQLPMVFGGVDEAAAFLTDMGPASRAVREAGGGDALREKAQAAIRSAILPHARDGRVELPSAIWVVRARKP